MKPKRVDVESTFNNVVTECGGLVLDTTLPFVPNFENADYVFHFEKVIAELKCLGEDNVHSENNKGKISDLMKEWYEREEISSEKLDNDTWKNLPTTLQTEIYRVLTKNIKRRISKANRQIRETKANLSLDSYNGLLILVNDGVFSIPPAMFIHAVQMNLKNNYREIREFIYVTSNIYTKIRGVSKPVIFWISFNMEDGEKISQTLIDRLGTCWKNAHAKASGIFLQESELEDVEGFWNANHTTKI